MNSAPIIDEYVASARQQCSLSNYEESVVAYRLAQNTIATFLRSVKDDTAIQHYTKVQQLISDELNIIEDKILPSIDEAIRLLDFAREEDSRDSPPVDPQNASPVRPSAINFQSFGRPKQSSGQAKNANEGSSFSRVNRRIQPNAKIQKKPLEQESSFSNKSSVSNKSINSKSGDDKKDPSVLDKMFDMSGFDNGLVTLIENGIVLQDDTLTVRFNSVAGLKEAKELLLEAIVWPVMNPDLFKGIRRPSRGICMFGPPGTGKTMLAKAVASECNTTFFNVSSAVLTSKYRGDSEKLVKILFDVARARAPSTIFIDEVDSICSRRGAESEHEASRRAKSELLVQMDGLSSGLDDKLVVVLAATNFPWDLDEALIRRLEKRIYIPLPDFAARLNLLQTLLIDMHIGEDVKLEDVANKLEGYSGSDIANICRDAAMAPMRELFQKKMVETGENLMLQIPEMSECSSDLTIRMEHFDSAILKIMPSVSDDKLRLYENWMKKYGSK